MNWPEEIEINGVCYRHSCNPSRMKRREKRWTCPCGREWQRDEGRNAWKSPPDDGESHAE